MTELGWQAGRVNSYLLILLFLLTVALSTDIHKDHELKTFLGVKQNKHT